MVCRRRFVFSCMAALLAASSDAAAQPHAPGYKSPATGRWISVAATAVPLAVGLPLAFAGEDADESGPSIAGGVLCMLGTIIGPGAGHIYAGSGGSGRATKGCMIRLGIICGTAFIGMAAAPPDSDPPSNSDAGIIALAVGGAALLTFSVLDILSVAKSVEEHNAQQSGVTLAAVPHFSPHDKATGLCVVCRW